MSSKTSQLRARLVTIKRSGKDGMVYDFDQRNWCVIGAHEECDVRVHAAGVAELHALVTVQEVPTLHGLDHAHPAILPKRERSELRRDESATLASGDTFFIADRAFRFEYVSESDGKEQSAPTNKNNRKLTPAKRRKSLVVTPNEETLVKAPRSAKKLSQKRLSLSAGEVLAEFASESAGPVLATQTPKPPVFTAKGTSFSLNYQSARPSASASGAPESSKTSKVDSGPDVKVSTVKVPASSSTESGDEELTTPPTRVSLVPVDTPPEIEPAPAGAEYPSASRTPPSQPPEYACTPKRPQRRPSELRTGGGNVARSLCMTGPRRAKPTTPSTRVFQTLATPRRHPHHRVAVQEVIRRAHESPMPRRIKTPVTKEKGAQPKTPNTLRPRRIAQPRFTPAKSIADAQDLPPTTKTPLQVPRRNALTPARVNRLARTPQVTKTPSRSTLAELKAELNADSTKKPTGSALPRVATLTKATPKAPVTPKVGTAPLLDKTPKAETMAALHSTSTSAVIPKSLSTPSVGATPKLGATPKVHDTPRTASALKAATLSKVNKIPKAEATPKVVGTPSVSSDSTESTKAQFAPNTNMETNSGEDGVPTPKTRRAMIVDRLSAGLSALPRGGILPAIGFGLRKTPVKKELEDISCGDVSNKENEFSSDSSSLAQNEPPNADFEQAASKNLEAAKEASLRTPLSNADVNAADYKSPRLDLDSSESTAVESESPPREACQREDELDSESANSTTSPEIAPKMFGPRSILSSTPKNLPALDAEENQDGNESRENEVTIAPMRMELSTPRPFKVSKERLTKSATRGRVPPLYSAKKTISKTARKRPPNLTGRRKSVLFADEIVLPKGPHYSPRVPADEDLQGNPEPSPSKSRPSNSDDLPQSLIPQSSPSASKNARDDGVPRVLGAPPTSRLALLGHFFYPTRPALPLLEGPKNTNSDVDEEMCEDSEDEYRTLTPPSSEDDEREAFASPTSEDLAVSRYEPSLSDGQESDDEAKGTLLSSPAEGTTTTTDTLTPKSRTSIGQRLSSFFLGTPVPDTDTEQAPESSAIQQNMNDENQDSSPGASSSSSKSEASESEFLTVPEEESSAEPPRRRSLLGRALVGAVRLAVSPARTLFGFGSASKSEADTMSPDESESGLMSADRSSTGDASKESSVVKATPCSAADTPATNASTGHDSEEDIDSDQSNPVNLMDRFDDADESTPSTDVIVEEAAVMKQGESESPEVDVQEKSESTNNSIRLLSLKKPSNDEATLHTTEKVDEDTGDISINEIKEETMKEPPVEKCIDEQTERHGEKNTTMTPIDIVEEELEMKNIVDEPRAMDISTKDGSQPSTRSTRAENGQGPSRVFETWTVKELKELLKGLDVDCKYMRKAELVQKAYALGESSPSGELIAVGNVDSGSQYKGGNRSLESPDLAVLRETMESLTVAQLRAELKSLGKDTTGRKAELIDRLMEEPRQPDTTAVIEEELESLVQEASGVPSPAKSGNDDDSRIDVDRFAKRAEELEQKTVKQLRDILKKLCLDTSGKKAVLISRILSFEDNSNEFSEPKTPKKEVLDHDDSEDNNPEKTLMLLTVKKLRTKLDRLGLSSTGRKQDLVQRLLEASDNAPDTLSEVVQDDIDDVETESTTAEDFEKMTINELKALLRESGRCVKGRKAVLVFRLQEAQDSGSRRAPPDKYACDNCKQGKLCQAEK